MLDLSPSETRWMALDVGSKTIGLALTDPLKITVRPLLTLQRRSLADDCQKLLETARLHGVNKLIVGRPLHLDGTPSDILELVEEFVSEIARRSDVPVEWVDERLSSKEAEILMAEAGVAVSERRKRRNEFAAAIILRRYLEEVS
ncbi:MAG: Holliday junction resolvase RuvX [Acidobacteria bacterium]|nr:MAG: Holliday junction resolvase RuvX [Acidobacteriota bacterium]